MRIVLTVAALAAIASPALAQAAQQFDLICEGTMEGRNGDRLIRTMEFKPQYRVDLERGVWCGEDCSIVQDLVEVTPTRIQFLNQRPVGLQVDRTSGKLEGLSIVGPITTTFEGQCRRVPFSGIPAQAF